MLQHRSALLWAIVLYAACNALWTAFAASGLQLMEPSATMGDIRAVQTAWAVAQNWLAAALWAALAWTAWHRLRAALGITLALIFLRLLAWAWAILAGAALPDLPAGMIAIWVLYQLVMIAILALIAAYLWRMTQKARLT